MALISQTELETKLGRSLTTDETNAFTSTNESLQYLIEEMIGSYLESNGLEYRYYDGGVQHLSIDPCSSIQSIDLVDDDQTSTYTYDTTDYTKEPINKELKRYIRHRSGPFTTGINNIRVYADFSIECDDRILSIVKEAMLEALVSEISNTDNIKRESIEGYSIEYATTEVKDAISKIMYLFPQV